MQTLSYDHAAAAAALDRLIAVARSDTDQSRRVADFLLAWWNDGDNGAFPISHMFGVDREIGFDIATIVAFLAAHPGAIYADQFGRRDDMTELVELWRAVDQQA